MARDKGMKKLKKLAEQMDRDEQTKDKKEKAGPKLFDPHDEAFLKKWALDYYKKQIFTSAMLKDQDHLASQVFMPLIFMDSETQREVQDAAKDKTFGLVYEYWDKAGPRSINGFPMFTSCGFLCAADVKRIEELLEKIRKNMEEFEE